MSIEISKETFKIKKNIEQSNSKLPISKTITDSTLSHQLGQVGLSTFVSEVLDNTPENGIDLTEEFAFFINTNIETFYSKMIFEDGILKNLIRDKNNSYEKGVDPSFVVNFTHEGLFLEKSFTNTSNFGSNYAWNFGDGNTSSEENPVHVYESSDNFTVRLTVDNIMFYEENISTELTPTAGFTHITNLLTATFTDISENNVISWLWDFGDGSTSELQNPIHIYLSAGTYDVTLTVNGGNSVTIEVTVSLL